MRRIALPVAVVMSAAVVVAATLGSVAAGAPSPGSERAPDKTFGATSTVVVAPPTLAPPTVAPPTAVTPSLVPATFAPPPTAIAPTIAPTTTPGVATSSKFDALNFFTTVFQTMQADYLGLSDLASKQTVEGSPAHWFLLYLLGVAMAIDVNRGPEAPVYTVQPNADGVSIDVCRPDGGCDVFANFVDVSGKLSSFSVNGLDLTGRFGTVAAPVKAGALEFSSTIAFQRTSDGSLGIVLLLTAGAQPVQIQWDQTVYVNADGSQIALTSGLAVNSPGLDANAVGSAYLILPGALVGGELVVPVSSDNFVTTVPAHIPIVPAA